MTGTDNDMMNSLVQQMEDYGIDIDGRKNGIWLPVKDIDKITNKSADTSHQQDGLYGIAYKEELYERLNGKKKVAPKKELAKIKRELKTDRA